MTAVSVIICTYKRYDLTLNCLRTLSTQSVGRTEFEVIVIDNTPPAYRQKLSWKDHGADRCVVEDVVGLSSARNRGIREARGDLVVFIDDDAEAAPDWLAALRRAARENPEALAIGGRVNAKYLTGKPPWISEKLEEYLSVINWGGGTFCLAKDQWIVGANMAFRRSAFENFGFFNTGLGRAGNGTLLSNDETDLISKFPEGTIFFCGDAAVDHLIPAERTTQRWFRKRAAWQAISDVMAGKYNDDYGAYFFERFAAELPRVPAEHRSIRSLSFPCADSEEFERQLTMLYSLVVAMSLGLH